jgi:hypothetical protein
MTIGARPGLPRVAVACLLAALLPGVSVSPGRADAAVAAVPDKRDDASPKVTFPPDVEAKFVKYLAKLKETKRKLLEQRLQKEIEDISKTTGLSPEAAKALETPAREVTDICLQEWIAKTEETYRRDLRQPPAMLRQMFDMMLLQVDGYAKQDMLAGYVLPTEREVWTQALKRALTAEQAAAWENLRTERRRTFEKEMGDYLDRITENAREQILRSILGTAADIKRSLQLSKDRATALDQIARSAADANAAEWRKRAEKTCFQMQEVQRRQILKTRQFFMEVESGETPDQQKVWKDGLAGLLTPDELKLLDAARDERQSRRLRAMSMLLVEEFDEKAAFTASQRERLLPLATRLVNDSASLFSENESPYSIAFSAQTFLAIGARAKEDDLKGILDPIQWRHWQEACGQKVSDFDPENDGEPEEKTADAGARPMDIAEPEDLERAISDFLYEKSAKERNQMLPAMILKAEDAGRVAALSPHAIGRLETAARGASDKILGDWKVGADQWVRSIVRDANARNVKQRLRGIESYNMPRNTNLAPEKESIWTGVVKAELTAEQMAAWTKAVDERSAYRNKAIALAVLAEFDRRLPLTVEQWGKLEPLLAAAVNEYSAEISTMFGNPNMAKWYMQPYSIFIPVAALPEKDLKDTLGSERWERWTGNPEFANSRNYWSNIQQMHAMKVKMAK